MRLCDHELDDLLEEMLQAARDCGKADLQYTHIHRENKHLNPRTAYWSVEQANLKLQRLKSDFIERFNNRPVT